MMAPLALNELIFFQTDPGTVRVQYLVNFSGKLHMYIKSYSLVFSMQRLFEPFFKSCFLLVFPSHQPLALVKNFINNVGRQSKQR